MAKRYRLPEIEQEHNQPLDQLIPNLINETGSQKATAMLLGVSQATISMWVRDNGFVLKTICIKADEQPEGIAQ